MPALLTPIDPFDPVLIEAIEGELFATLESAQSETPKRLRIAVEYALGGRDEEGRLLEREERRRVGGKRARPLLLLSCAECVGGTVEAALPAAAAVELIHNFSLVHDDIEDADEERRHRPSLWVLSGVPQAINTGSHMQALVYSAALRLRERGVPTETVLHAIGGLTWAILRMTEGQHLDIRLQESDEPTLEGYWRMVGGKTAALLRNSCLIGAMVGHPNGRMDLASPYAAYGEAFGLAFQARDDYLGIWGDPEVTGKPVGSDLLRKKKSLPVVFALTEAEGAERRTLEHLFGRTQLTPDQADEIRHHLEELGAEAYTQAQVQRLTDEAFAALDAIRPAETDAARAAYDRLVGMTEFALHRER
ncbi:MAG: polyprenyl synthetase family protein [Armatimonadetes bacterium]|nr:polyprenyl synthetase family protein [Armatimonadota bacterium]